MKYMGEEYELVPYEELDTIVGTEVLIYNSNSQRGGLMLIADIRYGNLIYDHPSSWSTCRECSVEAYYYNHPNIYFLPYRKVRGRDTTLCYCHGPAEKKWCFDINAVAMTCCHCHKRKRS